MSERSGEFGEIDLPALGRIRNHWVDLEPLVGETGYDDALDPTELDVELTDGLGDAETARIDVQWSELGNYSFHYVDAGGVNWRFDRHPNTHCPEKHFHESPEAASSAVTPVPLPLLFPVDGGGGGEYLAGRVPPVRGGVRQDSGERPRSRGR